MEDNSFSFTVAASEYGFDGLGMVVIFLSNTCCLILFTYI